MRNQSPSLRTYRNYPGRRAIKFTDHIVDGLFVVLMLFLLLVAIYIKLDSDSVYQGADPKRWIQYKPDFPEDVVSFEDLQKKNPDVKGWITVYGTNIDYPVLFSPEDNNYYLNHNSLKEPESSGSIFLDYRNKPDLSDFNNILHGHHMVQHKMFGDLELFAETNFFEKHEFGNLFYNGKDNGIQIIAAILTDGFDRLLLICTVGYLIVYLEVCYSVPSTSLQQYQQICLSVESMNSPRWIAQTVYNICLKAVGIVDNRSNSVLPF